TPGHDRAEGRWQLAEVDFAPRRQIRTPPIPLGDVVAVQIRPTELLTLQRNRVVRVRKPGRPHLPIPVRAEFDGRLPIAKEIVDHPGSRAERLPRRQVLGAELTRANE